ncbi:MAG: hypothetical protein IPG45_23640 [Deltaproteobacteria bacterium]|nr:hypothetical protein [Deltaproteobacteria bacterium]
MSLPWALSLALLAAPGFEASAPGETKALTPPTTPPWKNEEVREWYGWQLIIADLTCLGVMMVSGSLEVAPVFLTGITTMVVGVPVLHGMHGRPITVIQSYALRIGGPLLGALIGGQGGRSDSGSTAGLVVGAVLAVLIDDLLLSHEVVEVRGLQPVVEVSEERSQAGISWSF